MKRVRWTAKYLALKEHFGATPRDVVGYVIGPSDDFRLRADCVRVVWDGEEHEQTINVANLREVGE